MNKSQNKNDCKISKIQFLYLGFISPCILLVCITKITANKNL